MAAFDERGIDTRPFFPPLSTLGAFAGYDTVRGASERNPVAYDIGRRAINLPSAMKLDRGRRRPRLRGVPRDPRRCQGGVVKALILAGGRGTRISEESQSRPKPMVEIGGRPILWHIMKIYGAAGINEFIVLLGYRGYMIKEYFANYFLHMSDVTIDLATDTVEVHQSHSEPWKVTLLDTGLETMTGGRLLRAKHHIGDDDFCFTYGDGVADVDVRDVIAAHARERRAPHASPPCSRWRATARCRIDDGPGRLQREAGGQRRVGQRWLLRRLAAACSTTSRTTRPCSSELRWSGSRRRASSARTSTTASGTAWTPCGTRSTSTSCGTSGQAPWKLWDD